MSEAFLATVNAIVKFVEWPAERIMAVRYTIDFVLCFSACTVSGLRVPARPICLILLLRGTSYCSFIGFLWAALRSCLPLGDVVVLVVTFSPISVVLLARLVLGEAIPRLWPLQFLLCVIGAALVNMPVDANATCPVTTSSLPLAAAFAGALMNLASRRVKDVPSPLVCIFNDVVAVLFAVLYMALLSPAGLAIPKAEDENLWFVILSAFIGWAGLICNVKGYQTVSVTAVASIAAFVSVPLGYFMQVVVFQKAPDLTSVLGATLIVCTNVGVTWQKYKAAQVAVEAEKQKPLLSDQNDVAQ